VLIKIIIDITPLLEEKMYFSNELTEKCMSIIEQRNVSNLGYVDFSFISQLFENLTEDNLEETVQIIIDEANRVENSIQ
tara:strand:- start:64 stop:300 length:237 start_codon:yes stop_codon:yes gene_type:complete